MRRGRLRCAAALVLLVCMMLTTAVAASYTKLRYKDTGTQVLRLQQALNQLGYTTGGADGKFGAATEKAVRQFQRDQGLEEDGVAGNATQSRLYQLAGGVAAPSTTAPSQSGGSTSGLFGGNYATLKYGSRGDRVKTLQNALNQLGFSAGTADGRFGLGTQVAVTSFQKSAGLEQDGKAGRSTLTALERAVSGEQTVTPAPSSGTAATPTPAPSTGGETIPTRILRLGMSGDDVKSVQTRLQALGYYAGSVDGKYGSGTLSAMQAFQSNNGLVVDGKAGKNTNAKLFSSSAVPAYATPAPGATATPAPTSGWTVPTRVLRKGYTGEDVRSVQTRLKALGYYTGTVDGKYGTGTMAAVQAFQVKNGLSADGKAGTATNARLFSDSALAADTVTASPAPTASPSPTPSPTATWNVPTRSLRIGDQGSDVSAVQTRLKELGYYTGDVDSKYGSGTVAAVLAFQAKHGLSQDGVAGSGTYTRLFSTSALRADTTPTAAPTATVHPTLRVGDQGSEVTKMQSALKQLKYTITVNGTYDQQTKTAVTSFQRLNGLGVDGVAGPKTLAVLYSSSAVTGDTQFTTPAPVKATEVPSTSQLKLMHWYNEVKPVLRGQKSIYVYEPKSGYGFTLHLYSLGRHADVEPMTAQDTANMMAAWGNKSYWEPVKFVYVKLPNGVWTVATMHNVAHGGQSIKNNNFDGQNCIHFLRDMSEAEKNDPSYGVKNQKALRNGWKALTGETVN